MDTWTRQAGFPVVSVTRNGTKLILSQRRFLADPDTEYSPNSSPYKYKWEIPITYITSNNETIHKLWFTKDQDLGIYHDTMNTKVNTNKFIYVLVTIDIPDVEWIKINYRQVGYYMVNYSESEWSIFSNLLEHNINVSIDL